MRVTRAYLITKGLIRAVKILIKWALHATRQIQPLPGLLALIPALEVFQFGRAYSSPRQSGSSDGLVRLGQLGCSG